MVETYIEPELQDLITDTEKTEEWKKKIEELRLNGQLTLIEGKKSPIPFPVMNQSMKNIYKFLCPMANEIQTYSRTTIPSRVLEMIGLSIKENYFKRLEIWFDEISTDPILVGHHNKELYLIARWGDELRSFSEICQLARIKKIETEKRKLETKLTSLEKDVDDWLNGMWTYFY